MSSFSSSSKKTLKRTNSSLSVVNVNFKKKRLIIFAQQLFQCVKECAQIVKLRS